MVIHTSISVYFYEIAHKKYIVVRYDGTGGTLTTRCVSVQDAVDTFNKYVEEVKV